MSTFSERLTFLIETHAKGRHTAFSKKAGIPKTTMQGYVDGRFPKFNHLVRIRETYGVNLDWLMTGEGEVYNKDRKGRIVAEEEPPYTVQKNCTGVDLASLAGLEGLGDLLKMTTAILTSKTEYSGSLAANIRSFYHSLELEKRTAKLESECDELRKEVVDLRKEVAAMREALKLAIPQADPEESAA